MQLWTAVSLASATPIHAYRGPRRALRWILLGLGLLIALAIGFSFAFVVRSTNAAADPQATPVTIEIPAGSDTGEIALQLAQAGIISNRMAFQAAVLFSGSWGSLQAGTYQLSASMTPRQIVELLSAGATAEITLTVPEGLRLDEVARLVEEAGLASRGEFLAEAKDPNRFSYAFLATLPPEATLEGMLFPDTYRFAPATSAHDIVDRMLGTFETRIQTLLPLIETSNLTLYELVTLASLVEAEVPREADRPVVANVFYNRLAEKMPLQADSTLAYVTGEDRIDFTTADTQIDDPYNTYKYAGLPPGPINAPGLTALQAVLQPADTEYLYFVSDPSTGETFFSKTLEEHEASAQRVLGE